MSHRLKDTMKSSETSLTEEETTDSSEMSLTEEETTDSSETSLTEEEETTKSSETSLTEEEAMRLLCSLSEAKKMKVPVKRRKRRSVGLASTGAFVGGLVGGPPGLAFGSAVGGLAGALVWSAKFKSVSQILKELPPAKQEKLCSQVSVVIEDLEWTDTQHLTKLAKGSKALQKQLLKLLEDYVTQELRTTVLYRD
ncbi:protein C19orf12 homolog [Myotis myotis]|uniref:protein C19orf12 homolog n=1 Tax=Myotis myotis TaxID=51298 RepID=UPI001748A278|nr:protein C19orf12 homolog [Myotis myotis]